MSKILKNKVALITGSSRGIGRATALLFAKEGAKIIVNYNTSSKEANYVVNEIARLGSEAIAIQCDISKEKQVANMLNKAVKEFGKIDILVNNAGVVFDVPLFERTIVQWRRTIDVNLTGNFLCSKYVAKQLLKQKSGKIINISSTNATNNNSPESIDYDASKAGIISMTKNFAKELSPSIQVNAIAPGWVETDMNKNLPEEFLADEKKKVYLKRFAQPEEIAKVALFLASENSNYITGSVLVADGGHD